MTRDPLARIEPVVLGVGIVLTAAYVVVAEIRDAIVRWLR